MIEEDSKTIWCGNLPEQCTEELLYELFLQAGPLEKVRIARDRDGRQRNFAFITYRHEVSVPYAINLFRGTALFHKTLSLQSRGRTPMLPPPIRCFGPDPTPDFIGHMHSTLTQQFAEMTDKLKEDYLKPINTARKAVMNDLVLGSLQGNWSHRQHPYKLKDKPHNVRDDYRPREMHSDSYKGSNRYKHSSSWRDRRPHKKGNNYYKRD